jgi:hypothetical protein
MKKLFLTIIFVISFALNVFATDPLRVHPTNPRYFTDDSGEAIYLTGSHTWYNIHNRINSPEATDQAFTDYLDWMESHGQNFVRLWTGFSYADAEPYPWDRTGPGTATMDGLPKFDMTQFNQDYFDIVKARVLEVQSRGMYCSIMFFGSYVGIGSNLSNTAWHEDNNINSELASAFTDDGHSFCTTDSDALDIEKSLINKFVDELNDVDNLIFEIANEVGGITGEGDCVAWHHNMIDHVISYETTKPKQHVIGMTGGYSYGSELLSGNHEYFSPDLYSMGYYEGGSASYSDKIVISDTDHIRAPSGGTGGWGYSQLQYIPAMKIWVWETFARGNHPILMDWYDRYHSDPAYGQTTGGESGGVVNTAYDPIRDAMGDTLNYANRFSDLAAMIPSESDSSTTYCLRNPGQEYLAYQPGSGSFTVNLVAGDYNYEWFNPNTNSIAETGSFTAGSGNKTFTPPFSGDAVLYLNVGSISLPALPSNGIIDNGDPGTSYTGTWNPSGAAGYYGSNSLYADDFDDTYTWAAQLPASGQYDINMWWTEYASRYTAVPVRIYDDNTQVWSGTINQQANGGQWNNLTTLDFSSNIIRITVEHVGTVDDSTSADAVRILSIFITNPFPVDDDTGIAVSVPLSWDNPAGEISVDVYIEEKSGSCDLQVGDKIKDDQDINTVSNADLLTFLGLSGNLDGLTTYCWRVDVNHAGGIETGNDLEFTTTEYPDLPPSNVSGITFSPEGVTGTHVP